MRWSLLEPVEMIKDNLLSHWDSSKMYTWSYLETETLSYYFFAMEVGSLLEVQVFLVVGHSQWYSNVGQFI